MSNLCPRLAFLALLSVGAALSTGCRSAEAESADALSKSADPDAPMNAAGEASADGVVLAVPGSAGTTGAAAVPASSRTGASNRATGNELEPASSQAKPRTGGKLTDAETSRNARFDDRRQHRYNTERGGSSNGSNGGGNR